MGIRTRLSSAQDPIFDWVPAPSHAPALNTRATATQGAAGRNRVNVLTGFVITVVGDASAPAAKVVKIGVVDGPSGSTSYLWGPLTLAVPAVAGAVSGVARDGLWIQGSPNTPMTIEFDVAGGANTFESVVMEGTTQPL